MTSKKEALFIASLIILWYSANIGVLLLNKFLLSNYGFGFPIFLTMCHMSACAVLSYISIVFLKIAPLQRIKSRSQLLRIATLSIVFCGSVVGGNISLSYLPVSFNQAVGATTPFFTAVFAYLMTFKREAWVTYAALVPVVTGVVIASGGEPSFHLYGFIMCISATAARAFKSVLQGILLSSEGEMLNSMNLLLYMSPIAVLVLLPATLLMEPDVLDVTLSLGMKHRLMWLLLSINSVAAYLANLSNFLVTKHTSALTLQVLGNAKGAVAVVISILFVSKSRHCCWYWWLHNDCYGGNCLRRSQAEIQMMLLHTPFCPLSAVPGTFIPRKLVVKFDGESSARIFALGRESFIMMLYYTPA